MPKINLNCEEVPCDSGNITISPGKPVCHYNLHSFDERPATGDLIGGLGMDVPQISMNKSRGRKYFLSKAQVKAKFDVADGKQLSFPRVLRAAKPCGDGSK